MPIPVLNFPELAGSPFLSGMQSAAKTMAIPQKIALAQEQLKQSQSRFGPGYQGARMIQSIPSAMRGVVFMKIKGAFMKNVNELLAKGLTPEEAQASAGKQMGVDPAAFAGTGSIATSQSQVQPVQQTQPVAQPQQSRMLPQQQTAQVAQPQQSRMLPQIGSQQQPVAQPQQAVQPTYEQKAQQLDDSAYNRSLELGAIKGIVSPKTYDRAHSAVILDRWLQDDRDKYSKRINNALKYSGTIGKGKAAIQELLRQNPDALSDHNWFMHTFPTLMTNNIAKMEGMGSTIEARKEANDMVKQAVNQMTTYPKRARMTLNKMFSSIIDQSRSVYAGVEPNDFKGTFEKSYGIKPLKGGYISTPAEADQLHRPSNIENMSSDDLQKIARGG